MLYDIILTTVLPLIHDCGILFYDSATLTRSSIPILFHV